MSDLKPCPFCGSEARHYVFALIEHYITCTNPKCYAETHRWTTEAEAVEAWNTRTLEQAVAANYATDITLRSYADSDFVRWVDWAQAFVVNMERAPLDDEQKEIVRSVLNRG